MCPHQIKETNASQCEITGSKGMCIRVLDRNGQQTLPKGYENLHFLQQQMFLGSSVNARVHHYLVRYVIFGGKCGIFDASLLMTGQIIFCLSAIQDSFSRSRPHPEEPCASHISTDCPLSHWPAPVSTAWTQVALGRKQDAGAWREGGLSRDLQVCVTCGEERTSPGRRLTQGETPGNLKNKDCGVCLEGGQDQRQCEANPGLEYWQPQNWLFWCEGRGMSQTHFLSFSPFCWHFKTSHSVCFQTV